MANAANIVVKKADGTTDVTYHIVVPSSGDKSPAVWRPLSVASSNATRAEFRLTTELTGTGGRRFIASYSYPSLVTDSTTGRASVAQRGNFTLSGVFPAEMPDTDVTEFIAQGINLLGDSLTRTSLRIGYAPT